MHSRRLALVIVLLVLAVIGCAPSPTTSSSNGLTGPTASPSATPTASPEPVDRAADLRARIAAGADAELALLTAMAAAAADGNVDGARIGANALADWANGESAWLNDLPSDPCLDGLVDTYRDATGDLALAAINVAVSLLPGGEGEEPATGDDLEFRFARLDTAHEAILAAAQVAIVTTCVGEAPVPTEVAGIEFSPEAYLALADEVNAFYAALRAEGLATSDPIAAARSELEAIESAEATAATWHGGPSALDDLKSAFRLVATLLREVGDSASIDEARNAHRLATFALMDVVAAAEAIRATLDLPALNEDDVL